MPTGDGGTGVENAWLGWILPSLGALLAAMALWLPLGPVAGKLFGADGDVGRHIRVGSYILETGSIPRVDLFSHTLRGEPFVPYEWLSEVLFAGAHEVLGLAGVALLTALLFSATCYLVYWITVRQGVSRPLAVLAATYTLQLQVVHLLPRPHLFTTFLTAVWFALLLEHRRSGKHALLWALPPTMVLWANLHGGFLVGFILLVVFLADAGREARLGDSAAARGRLHALGIAGAASLVAALANPVGYELLLHTAGYLQLGYLADHIKEYLSPDFHHSTGRVLLAGLLLAVLLAMLGRAKIRFLEGALFLLWLVAALQAARNLPLFGVLVVPGLARWTSETVRGLSAEPGSAASRLLGPVVRWEERISVMDARCKPLVPGLLLAGVILWSLVGGGERYAFSERKFPVRALEAAREGGVTGRVFNVDFWGGFLLYKAFPEYPVFIDGQFDFYGERLTREYFAAVSLGSGWEQVLEKYRIDWTLTGTQAPLNVALGMSPDWRLFYRDSVATIFVRSGGGAPEVTRTGAGSSP
jgi:hypothetical protein